MSEDLSLEIQKYPLILDFDLEYTHIVHEYDNFYQRDPEENRTFDPYYGVVQFDYDTNNVSNIDYWDKTIAPQLELTLMNKWYISLFEFGIVQKKMEPVVGFTTVESVLILFLLLISINIFKRKTKYKLVF